MTDTATGHGAFGGNPVNSNTATATVTAVAVPAPALALLVTASPTTFSSAGTLINYSYQLTNSGNVALAGPFTVTDDRAADEACPATASLAPGGTITCTGSYTTTQADYDVGSVTDTATGHGSYNATPVDSNTATATVTATGQAPALALLVTASPTIYASAGTVIGYSYLLANAGNVSLTGPFTVTDDRAAVTCPADATLAVGAFVTCTGSYTTTQADVDAGSVTNTATGHGSYNGSPVDSNIAGVTITVGTPKTRVIVANGDDDSVSLVSLDTMSVLATIPLSGTFPWEVSVSPDQTKAYVSCRGSRDAVDPGGIAVVDLVTQAETAYITGLSGIDPAQSVVVGNVLYVVYADATPAPYISAVDLSVTPPVESAVLTLPTLNGALSIAATHDGGRLYVGTWNEGIYSVDISQVPAVITDIGAPLAGLNEFIHDLSIDAAGILYAATEGDDLVERYDTVTGVWLDGVAHAFPDGLFYLHGVEAAGNLISPPRPGTPAGSAS